MGYDAGGNITAYTSPSLSQSYAYDANGNRTVLQATPGGTSLGSYVPNSNRLQGQTGPTVAYTLDASGNAIAMGSLLFGENVRSQLSQSIGAAGTINYIMNGLDERIYKAPQGGPTTAFVSDAKGRMVG